jgi:hypothetical protein
LIVISFIFPATAIRCAQAASADASTEYNVTASANMTEKNANMPGPIVPTPKENTTSPSDPMKNTTLATYGCQWPIPTGEGHVNCAPN